MSARSASRLRLPLCFLELLAFFAVTGPRAAGADWFAAGASDAERVLHGEWWRTITALTLHADGGRQVPGDGQAVWAPRLAEAADQRFIAGIQEQHLRRIAARLELIERARGAYAAVTAKSSFAGEQARSRLSLIERNGSATEDIGKLRKNLSQCTMCHGG